MPINGHPKLPIWLIAGQSNAFRSDNVILSGKFHPGAGPTNPKHYPQNIWEALQKADRNWRHKGKFSALGAGFAEELYETANSPVSLINGAMSGMPIQTWYSSEGYDRGVSGVGRWISELPPGSMFKEWIAPLSDIPLSGVLWWQGESNIQHHAHYGAHLKRLIAEWRALFKNPELPFVIVEMHHISDEKDSDLEAFRAAQRSAVEQTPFCYLVESKDIAKSGDLHPPLDQNRAIGRRCAEVWIAMSFGGQH